MCLKLSNDGVVQIATEDIVCYKFVNKILDWDNVKPDSEFSGTIKGQYVEGKLRMEYGEVFLCQNEFDGSSCNNRLGYKYSWFYDAKVEILTINGKIHTEVVSRYETPYMNSTIEIGKSYQSTLEVDNCNVERGLHSFADAKSAFIEASSNVCATAVVKCIIPKGSKYYVGTFSTHTSYASNNIKYVEIIKE